MGVSHETALKENDERHLSALQDQKLELERQLAACWEKQIRLAAQLESSFQARMIGLNSVLREADGVRVKMTEELGVVHDRLEHGQEPSQLTEQCRQDMQRKVEVAEQASKKTKADRPAADMEWEEPHHLWREEQNRIAARKQDELFKQSEA